MIAYIRPMPRKPIELPAAVARSFIADTVARIVPISGLQAAGLKFTRG
jgi:hypothetical protein